MYIHAKCAAAFQRPNEKEYIVPNGYVGNIPEWISETPYFSSLVADGSFIIARSNDKPVAELKSKTKK